MKRVLANMSNGYCGCDEQYIMSFSDDASSEEIWNYLLEAYTYNDGFAGSENFEEEAKEEGYDSIEEFWEAQIGDYSGYKEISEEEYRSYIEKDIEER